MDDQEKCRCQLSEGRATCADWRGLCGAWSARAGEETASVAYGLQRDQPDRWAGDPRAVVARGRWSLTQ